MLNSCKGQLSTVLFVNAIKKLDRRNVIISTAGSTVSGGMFKRIISSVETLMKDWNVLSRDAWLS